MGTPPPYRPNIPARKLSRTAIPIARFVLALVLLIIIATIAYREFRALNQYNKAIAIFETQLGGAGPLPTLEAVNAALGRNPDDEGTAEGAFLKHTYTYKGYFRKHVIQARFSKAPPQSLITFQSAGATPGEATED